MKRLIVVILLLIVLLGCSTQSKTSGTVTMSDGSFVIVEIADQFGEKIQGLSGRDHLEADQGMLFIFSQADYPGVWMRGMKFSIDIVFLNDQEIVDIIESAPIPQDSNYPTYKPRNPANYVLELPAGYAKEHQLRVGETVRIEF